MWPTPLGLEGLESVSLLLVAPAIGSFLGVVVRRLPRGQAMSLSRSRCESCGAVLRARDMMPLVSWLAARGGCRHCRQRLGWFYPAIESAALLIAVIALAADGTPRAWLDSILGWWLLTLAWIDQRHGLLPDPLTLPLIIAGLAAAALLDPHSLLDRTLAAVVGYLAFRALAATYRALRGREGLGGGDAKLAAAIGAWLGLAGLPQAVLAAALLGLGFAGVLSLRGVRLHAASALPFGPFLALGAWLIWLTGPILM